MVDTKPSYPPSLKMYTCRTCITWRVSSNDNDAVQVSSFPLSAASHLGVFTHSSQARAPHCFAFTTPKTFAPFFKGPGALNSYEPKDGLGFRFRVQATLCKVADFLCHVSPKLFPAKSR